MLDVLRSEDEMRRQMAGEGHLNYLSIEPSHRHAVQYT
jgi:hypothetical protein